MHFLPLDAGKAFAKRNLRIAIRYPNLIAHLIRGGRTEAYRELHRKVLSELSDLSDDEIRSLLDKTIKAQRLTLSREFETFNGSIGLVPQVMVYYLTRTYKPLRVVETGVWTGKTSWFILQALENNKQGTLVSIDLGTKELIENDKIVQTLSTKEIGGLVPTALRHRWTLLIGNSAKLLKDLATQRGRVDLFLHDSDHEYNHMIMEFDTMWPVLSEGGILCSDDIARNQAWPDFLKKVEQAGIIIQSIFGICQKTTNQEHKSGAVLDDPMAPSLERSLRAT